MPKIISIAVFILLISGSCATPIKKLYKKPDKFQGKKICIKGKVISSIELIDLCSFTVRDRTEKIVIVTENLLPLKNDKVRIKGVFDKNFKYKEQKMYIIKEKKIKGRKMEGSKSKVKKL
jgi:hypothetical protein